MKKGIGFLFLALAITALVYFYFFPRPSSGNLKLLLPETSLFALQVKNISETSKQLKSQPWFDALKDLPLISQFFNRTNLIESLESSGTIKSSLTNLELWLSMHTTSSDELTPLFFIKSNGFEWQWASIETVLEDVTKQEMSSSSQSFNGRDIKILRSNDITIAALIEGPYLIFSQNTLLLEDVVRATQEGKSRLLSETDQLSTDGDINLIINTSRLDELSSVFYQENAEQFGDFELSGNLTLSLDLMKDKLVFRGTGDRQQANASLASVVFGKNLIPIISSSFTWSPNKVIIDELDEFLNSGVCTVFLNQGGDYSEQVFIFSVKDTASVSKTLFSAATERLTPSDSAVYNERFINSSIGYINDVDYLAKLVRRPSTVKGAPFYALFQQVLLVSENLDALKTVLNDFDAEATWGRSVEKRRILDDMVQETDLTYVQDFEFASDPIKKRLKPKWREFFEANPQALEVLDLFKFQLNRTSSSLLVSGDLAFRENFQTPTKSVDTNVLELDILANVFVEGTIASKPYVVRNHNNSQLEVVFQDNNRNLYLTNKQGEVLWKKPLSGPISGDVHQIDYYRNKKLQYLVFSDSLIHLIDRNGNDVDGFPKSVSATRPFNGSNVIDYDNSRQYRYLGMDRRGNVSLFDRDGEILEGWNPNSIGSSLLETPFHVRIRGRDCFVAVETSGKVHLLNRKGEAYDGFPVAIDGRFSGDIALSRGANFKQTLISLMSEEGEFIQVNFEGEIVSQKQFVRPNTNTAFSLVYDALKTTFNIVQNDGRTLTIFNDNSEEIFTVNYPNSKEVSVDLYNFRNGKEVFVIRDTREHVMRMVDRQGRFLTSVIPNNERVSILYYQNRLEYEVFVNFANQMNIYAVKPL